MANENISSQILGAIDIAVDKKLQQANFDKTVEGYIISCIDQMTSKYRVSIDGVETNAYALNNSTYSVGDIVYIKFQNGTNITDKQIIGKKSVAPNISGLESLSFNQRYDIAKEFSFDNYKAPNGEKNLRLWVPQLDSGKTIRDYVPDTIQALSSGLSFKLTVGAIQNYKSINDSNDYYTFTLYSKEKDASGNNKILTTITMDQLEGNPYRMQNQLQTFMFTNSDFANFASIDLDMYGKFEVGKDTEDQLVTISDIKFYVAQDLYDPNLKDYIIRKEEYGKYDTNSWIAFKKAPIGTEVDWQQYDAEGEEWVNTTDTPTHIRTWIEMYNEGKRVSKALACNWFLANAAIDTKSEYYSSYMGTGWEKKGITCSVNTDEVDLNNSLIISLNELPLQKTQYACYMLLDYVEFQTLKFIITNPLKDGTGTYTVGQNQSGTTIAASLKYNDEDSGLSNVKYYWTIEDVFNSSKTIAFTGDGTNEITITTSLVGTLQYRVNVKAYWENNQTQFLLAENTSTYRNASETNLYSLQITNAEQVFYYSGGVRESAEPVAIEAKLIKANLNTGEWQEFENNWILTAEISTNSMIDSISRNINDDKKCGFIVKDIFNASAVDNQINFTATIGSGTERVEVATAKTNFTFIQSGDPGTNGTEYVVQVYDKNNSNNQALNFIFHPQAMVNTEKKFVYTFAITDLVFDDYNHYVLKGFKYVQRVGKYPAQSFSDIYTSLPVDFPVPNTLCGIEMISATVIGDGDADTFIESWSLSYNELLDGNNQGKGEIQFNDEYQISNAANLAIRIRISDSEWETCKDYTILITANQLTEIGGLGTVTINPLDNQSDWPQEIYAISVQTTVTPYNFNSANYGLKLTNIHTGEEEYIQSPTATLITEHHDDEDEPRLLTLHTTHNDIDYYAYAPVVMVDNQNDIPFDPQSGFNYILYGSNGKNPRATLKPFIDMNGDKVPGAIDEDNTKGYLEYKITESIFSLTQKPHDINDKYITIKVNNHIVPILLLKNRYEYASINGWDGSELQIDKDGQYFLSPMGGFGQKEDDNSFTGVVLGESSKKQNNQTSIGLMAYNKGERTVFIDARTGGAYFKGEIVATSGKIGGWHLYNNVLSSSETKLGDIFLTPNGINIDNESIVFKASEKFMVSDSGKMFASAGRIGNWEIGTNVLKGTAVYENEDHTKIESQVQLLNANNYYAQSREGAEDVIVVQERKLDKDNKQISIHWPFALWKDGTLTTSKIKATGGTIGGYTISTNALYSGDPAQGNQTYAGLSKYSVGPAFWAGANDYSNAQTTAKFKVGHEGNLYIGDGGANGLNTPFKVTKEGSLFAKEAKFFSADTFSTASSITIGQNIQLRRTFQISNWGYDHTWYIKTDNSGDYIYTGRVIMGGYATNRYAQSGLPAYIQFVPQGTGVEPNKPVTGPSYKGQFVGLWEFSSQSSVPSPFSVNSDQKLKHNIMQLNTQYSILFDNLRSVMYKYNNGTSDRFHTGFIAQDVKAAMDIAGLTTQEFAALTIENYDKPEEEQIWRLRYEEFIALNTDQIQKLKKRVALLEAQLAEIKGETNENI